MKLRTKVIIAFFIMIILPISAMILTVYAITYVQQQEVQDSYGIELNGYESLANSTLLQTKMTTDMFVDLLELSRNDPGALADASYQKRINDSLQRVDSYLIIRKDDKLIYTGEEKANRLKMYLPAYGSYDMYLNGSTYIASETTFVRGVDFFFPDGAKGSAFIATNVNNMLPHFQEWSKLVGFGLIICIIITAVVLLWWIYGSIVNPLQQLETAINHIKQGDLQYKGKFAEDHTEIGMICADFEEMRLKLVDSMDEIEKYNRESRELIANISHDLKTPITSVKGYIEGIRDGVADTPEKQERYLAIIYNKALEMDRLISELNIYSKIETNKMQYSFQVINISGYFLDCVEEVGMDLQANNIDLNYYDYTDKNINVKVDPEQIKRVINNIIGNSVKYMDKDKGFINIYLKDEGEEVLIEIEDNGKGIGQADLGKIFERFYRTDASRNSSQGGSGIGLSIVKMIIHDHGGKLWATSKEKKGTTIHFTLKKYIKEDEK